MIHHGPQGIYKKDELIKALNNFSYDRHNWLGIQITMYSGVTDIHYEIDKRGFANLYIDDQAGVTPLNDLQIKKLYNEAKVWYQQQLHLEKLAIQWTNNHPNDDENPYGNRWDGQMEYLSKSNLLGQTFAIREEYIDHEYNYSQPSPKSHSTWCNWGHGRTGHPQSAFAKDNHFRKQEIQSLVNEYPNNIIRHSNRQVNKHHSCDFPVFDDPEYLLSRHSTGWKHSSKAYHQYNQHVGKTKTFDKRQQSHLFNDWTAQDEYEAHGGDYYAPRWWADQPDPNLTPMSDVSKTQKWNDEHSAFNINYIEIKKG